HHGSCPEQLHIGGGNKSERLEFCKAHGGKNQCQDETCHNRQGRKGDSTDQTLPEKLHVLKGLQKIIPGNQQKYSFHATTPEGQPSGEGQIFNGLTGYLFGRSLILIQQTLMD